MTSDKKRPIFSITLIVSFDLADTKNLFVQQMFFFVVVISFEIDRILSFHSKRKRLGLSSLLRPRGVMCQWRWAMLEQSCMVMMIARDIIWYTWQVRRKSQVAEMSIDANMIMKKNKGFGL
jgi:hypothetical protein